MDVEQLNPDIATFVSSTLKVHLRKKQKKGRPPFQHSGASGALLHLLGPQNDFVITTSMQQ